VANIDRLLKDLRTATQDLYQMNPWLGLLRFGVLGVSCLAFVGLAWSRESLVVSLAWTFPAGLIYAFWLICSHDAVHHTLTGWVWFDELSARPISWLMLWPVGIYSELHRLHHSWNGRDLRDPERVQWTLEEYRQASLWQQWYVRYQWFVDLLLLGGIGLILKTWVRGFQLRSVYPRLTRQMFLDSCGMVLMQGSLVATILLTHQSLLHYILFWLVLERTIGVVMQTRDYLEHYGLWRNGNCHQVNQLYTSRNLRVPPGCGWLVGGLHYHAVHHAFPGIPYNQLATAFQRVQAVLVAHNCEAMVVGDGYVREALKLAQHPALIDRNRDSTMSQSATLDALLIQEMG